MFKKTWCWCSRQRQTGITAEEFLLRALTGGSPLKQPIKHKTGRKQNGFICFLSDSSLYFNLRRGRANHCRGVVDDFLVTASSQTKVG